MGEQRFGGVRVRIAHEAARLMYEENVKQYFTAKRMAAKRLLGKANAKKARFHPQDLPSNGEIRDALLAMAELAEGSRRSRVLFAMRVVALEAMRELTPFSPRLIGSVSTGHVRRGSDIDIHVFCDEEEFVESHLRSLGWVFDTERVSIVRHTKVCEYVHFQVADVVPVELTLYPCRDLHSRPRSSTDGKPIVKVSVAMLEQVLADEHPDAWAQYLDDGTVVGSDELYDDDPVQSFCEAKGPFDGWLLDADTNATQK